MGECKVIIVEGIIGAGKSVLSRELGKALGENTLMLMEPDEKEGRNPYLADFYEDRKRWAFTIQLHLLQSRFAMHLQAQWHVMNGVGHAVLDRSYFGDTAFARLQVAMGDMTVREFETYRAIYHRMTASVLLPNVCVRLLVAPHIAQRRIMARMERETGRKCETAIEEDYLVGLDREIDHMADVLKRQGVAVLDMPWDVDRLTEADRQQAVEGLAARIKGLEPLDLFLDLHRRTT
jgi:hypothetical protein